MSAEDSDCTAELVMPFLLEEEHRAIHRDPHQDTISIKMQIQIWHQTLIGKNLPEEPNKSEEYDSMYFVPSHELRLS